MKKPSITAHAMQVISEEIMAGKHPSDRPFATEATLCQRFSISRMTARVILSQLEEKGLVYRRRRLGTFASRPTQIRPVAIVSNDIQLISSSYFTALIQGAHQYLRDLGSGLLIASLSVKETPDAKSISGLIIPPGKLQPEDLEHLSHSSIPYILVMESDLPGPTIHMQPQKAAADLVKRLLSLGHRNFALIRGHTRNVDRQKWLGIMAALDEANVTRDHVLEYQTEYDSPATRSAVQAAVSDFLGHAPRPTAVIAFDDDLALQAMTAIQQRGLVVPRDISVTGFNDFPFSALTTPSISTVRFPIHEAGRVAAAAVVDAYLHRRPIADRHLDFELVWRDSTGPAP